MIAIKASKPNAYGIKHFVLDTDEDFKDMSQYTLYMGSTAYVIKTQKTYIYDGNKQWKLVPLFNSNGGGGGGNLPNPDDSYIYDGGVIV